MRRSQVLWLAVAALAVFGILHRVSSEFSAASLRRRVKEAQDDLILPRPYLFIHVPKSGGTAVGKLAELAENGGGESFIRYWHHPTLQPVIDEMLQHDFVFGHFKWGTHKHFAPRNCTYMAFFRDPVDRVLSHYYYHRSSTADRFHSLAMRNPLSKWVEISNDGQNDQTQFISGVYGKQTEKELQMALEHLDTFGVVGIYERLDESMLLLRFYMGFENIILPHSKAVDNRPPLEAHKPELLAKIEQYNALDRRLYDHAMRRMDELIARIGPVWYEELARYRAELAMLPEDACDGCLHLNGTSEGRPEWERTVLEGLVAPTAS